MPVEVEAEDCKAAIDQKCHPKCTTVWEVYKACETRIEEKVYIHLHHRAVPPLWSITMVSSARMRFLTLLTCLGVLTSTGPGQLRRFLHGLLQVRSAGPRTTPHHPTSDASPSRSRTLCALGASHWQVH